MEDPGSWHPVVRALGDDLITLALRRASIEEIVPRVGAGLRQAGVPVDEIRASARTLHPTVDALGMTWRSDSNHHLDTFRHADAVAEDWRRSPLYFMLKNSIMRLHRPLHRADCERDFDVLEDFAADGVTDYLVHLFPFDEPNVDRGECAIVRWISRHPGGFSESDLRIVDDVAPRVAAAIEPGQERTIARTLLDTYVGKRSGAAVLEGSIQPGQTQAIDAVILIADLAGFTAASDSLPGESLAGFLDRHLEAMVPPVHRAEGEILAFLGDGFLAAFDVEGDPAQACARGVAASRAMVDAIAALRTADPTMLALEVALHVGTVRYGNVGADGRQAFTVIGPAVNLTSRIEALCGPLGHAILLSESVARHLPPDAVRSIGAHSVKGLDAPVDLFTLI